MIAPGWLSSVIRDFGKSAGIDGLALNERGAAALAFENGVSLRLEYSGEELVMAATIPAAASATSQRETLKRLLALSHPSARLGFRFRTGCLAKTGAMLIAVQIPERDVTLPRVNAAFAALWRFSGEIGGGAWA